MGCVEGAPLVCDNGLYCDGAETCDPELGCQASVPVVCDDGVSCTLDACNEETDSCDAIADNSSCDDLIACTDDMCTAE
ncbi:MAG: hypothetical protein H6765_10545 [Candidatus Peribacteria bacterium]|nr:MAG: hypothetical protein H6765_10545 [Candidatus Peribacteria bacterium]